MIRRLAALCAILAWFAALPVAARSPIAVGTLQPGRYDAITDVAGVRVAHVTKTSGEGRLVPGRGPVRTGATAVVPDDDPWNQRVAAATYDLNGNGEMTGAHWIDEAGFMEVPIVLTDTLDVGRADDGVIDWMIKHYPDVGVQDDVPLPVVAECDDQGMNDIQGRHVSAGDVVSLLDGARSGDFARGNAGAGTGMHGFGFKGGIGSASRVLSAAAGGYTVGVLLNLNSGQRAELRVDGVPVGRILGRELLPVFHHSQVDVPHGRSVDGSIVVIVATDAPLDALRLREIAKRATLGVARTGLISHVSSGDLFLAFSTMHRYPRSGGIAGPPLETSEERIDSLFAATADAAEEAIYDALFSARTMTGANGNTLYALPYERVAPLLTAGRREAR